MTSDGLRVTLFDRARRPLFEDKTTELTQWGQFVMQNLAWLIERHHFRVIIDGHTRAQIQFPKDRLHGLGAVGGPGERGAEGAWCTTPCDPASVERVTGYADTRPVDGEPPESESNQRITLSLSLSPNAKVANGSAAPPAGNGGPGSGRAATAGPRAPRCRAVSFNPPHHEPIPQGTKTAEVTALEAPGSDAAYASRAWSTRPRRPAHRPTVEVVKEGDKMSRLIVKCSCGERLEVECLYSALGRRVGVGNNCPGEECG